MIKIFKVVSDVELNHIAIEMKMSAVQNKVTGDESEKYPKTQEEVEKAKRYYATDEHKDWVANAPHIRKIFLENTIINLVLTVEILQGTERWHLSMTRMDIKVPEPLKVSDKHAKRIASIFFPDGYKEIPTKSIVYPNIRDFITPKVK